MRSLWAATATPLPDETLKRLPEDIREGYELFRWNIGQR